ncbi:hypothetical protein D3C85_1622160 [compost metagenome]
MVDALLALLLDRLAGLDQFLDVVGAFLADAGISAQACQPDLACVVTYVAQGTGLVLVFLLQGNFSHGAPHSLQDWRNCPRSGA